MSKILFSIIIPTYNRADFIVKTIQSILNQTYTNFEVIVVDDGSTDNTLELVTAIKDDRIIYYKKENAERGAARNYGANLAKGDYVNFFDSDDIALPNHLEVALKAIEEFRNPKVFHLGYQWINNNGNIFKIVKGNYGKANNLLIKGNIFSCNGVFIERTVILQNQFNEDRALSASEDYELWMRLAAKYDFYNYPEITSNIIDHDGRSVTTINKEALIQRQELMLKYLFENKEVNSVFYEYKNLIFSDAYSYISLHLALTNYKTDSLKYLFKSLKSSPLFLLKKRFFAIIKHNILNG